MLCCWPRSKNNELQLKTIFEPRAVRLQKLSKDVDAQIFLQVAANEKVFAMAGYSLNVQPEQMLN